MGYTWRWSCSTNLRCVVREDDANYEGIEYAKRYIRKIQGCTRKKVERPEGKGRDGKVEKRGGGKETELLNLLPLLDGWIDSTALYWDGTITKNVQTVVKREVRYGWLQNIEIITDDAYGGVSVEYNRFKSGFAYPATSLLLGYDNHAPRFGPVLREFNMTGPFTFGIYVTEVTAWGYPFKGHTAVYAKLGALSPFATATLMVAVNCFEIIDVGAFKKSLKKLYRELGLLNSTQKYTGKD